MPLDVIGEHAQVLIALRRAVGIARDRIYIGNRWESRGAGATAGIIGEKSPRIIKVIVLHCSGRVIPVLLIAAENWSGSNNGWRRAIVTSHRRARPGCQDVIVLYVGIGNVHGIAHNRNLRCCLSWSMRIQREGNVKLHDPRLDVFQHGAARESRV